MNKANAAVVAEFVGTFLLTGAVLFGLNPAIALGVIVLVIGPISGANVNPAVSLGLTMVNRLRTDTLVRYIVAQIAGALVAKVIFNVITGSSTIYHAQPLTTDTTQAFTTLIAEAIGAAVFVFGITMALSHKLSGVALAAAVGGALYLGAMFGGGLNPAVAIGTDNMTFAALVGPLVGATVGAWGAGALAKYIEVKK